MKLCSKKYSFAHSSKSLARQRKVNSASLYLANTHLVITWRSSPLLSIYHSSLNIDHPSHGASLLIYPSLGAHLPLLGIDHSLLSIDHPSHDASILIHPSQDAHLPLLGASLLIHHSLNAHTLFLDVDNSSLNNENPSHDTPLRIHPSLGFDHSLLDIDQYSLSASSLDVDNSSHGVNQHSLYAPLLIQTSFSAYPLLLDAHPSMLGICHSSLNINHPPHDTPLLVHHSLVHPMLLVHPSLGAHPLDDTPIVKSSLGEAKSFGEIMFSLDKPTMGQTMKNQVVDLFKEGAFTFF
ncbi:hypothetical protein ACFE04_019499 [Oxalis oulophora]